MAERSGEQPRRKWSDPLGTRRASVEHGGASPGRKPPTPGEKRRRKRQKRREQAAQEGMARRTARQSAMLWFGSRKMRKLSKRGKVRLTGVAATGGILTLIAGLVLFRGLTGIVMAGAGATAVGTSMYVRSRRRRQERTTHPTAATSPSLRQKRQMERNRRAGRSWDDNGAAQQQGGTGQVWVKAHSRDGDHVDGHWRDRPGGTNAQQAQGRTVHGRSPNSNADGDKLRKQGKCPDCGDRGLWTDFGTPGEYRHVTCPKCGK